MTEINRFSISGNEPVVRRKGEAGNGGAHAQYEVVCPVTGDVLLEVNFQQGSGREGWRGVLDLSLLEIVVDRLTAFQNGPYTSRETGKALTHVEEAALWQVRRVLERQKRGVFDKQEK